MSTRIVDLSSLYGVLAIDGPDAATFLQGQATCDTRTISPAHAALGALCNLQGRMIVSFFAFAAPDGLRLVMPRDRVAPVLQHLKKYAVFSKVLLRDAGDERAIAGLFGTGADAAVQTLASGVPAEPRGVVGSDAVTVLRLRGRHHFLLLAAGMPVVAGATAGDAAHWKQSVIAAGELLVDGANADRYLPQAFNYDVIDGVSFKKGCYTGQEVVARMHFKGRMKERLYHGSTDAEAPDAGAPVFRAGETQPAGHVVDAVCTGERTHVAMVVRHDAVQVGLRLGDPQGAAISIAAMPYPVPDAG